MNTHFLGIYFKIYSQHAIMIQYGARNRTINLPCHCSLFIYAFHGNFLNIEIFFNIYWKLLNLVARDKSGNPWEARYRPIVLRKWDRWGYGFGSDGWIYDFVKRLHDDGGEHLRALQYRPRGNWYREYWNKTTMKIEQRLSI